MTPNNGLNFNISEHCEDDLEAYALGALNEEETAGVEEHLAGCFHCNRLLSGLEPVTAALAHGVPQAAPPHQLLSRLMDDVAALPQPTPLANWVERGFSLANSTPRFQPANFALPLAAALAIALLSASMIMHFLTTQRVNSLQSEPAALNERVNDLERQVASAADLMDAFHELDTRTNHAMNHLWTTSYLTAQANAQSFPLHPTMRNSSGEGVILVGHDGLSAVLMLANMTPIESTRPYQVWLSQNGRRSHLGEIAVDEAGQGALAVELPESLYDFGYIHLSVEQPPAGGRTAGERILQARIASPVAP